MYTGGRNRVDLGNLLSADWPGIGLDRLNEFLASIAQATQHINAVTNSNQRGTAAADHRAGDFKASLVASTLVRPGRPFRRACRPCRA